MESKITIACSPGTLNRVQNDNFYRKQVTEKVFREQGNYDVVVFSIYEEAVANEISQDESTAEVFIQNDFVSSDFTPDGKEKKFWIDAAVKLMLSKIQELRPKVGKCASIKSKQKMYSLVSACMAEKEISFTPTQIENKFCSPERQYKATVLNNKQTVRSRQICPFESEMSQILGNKRAVVPEFTLDSSEVEGLSRSEVLAEEVNSDTEQLMTDDSPSCSTQPAKKSVSVAQRKNF